MEHGGKAEFLHELFFNERKNEKAMLDAWKAFVEEEDDGR
jgi:hypothetical protein